MSVWNNFFSNKTKPEASPGRAQSASIDRITSYSKKKERIAEHDSAMHLIKNPDADFEWVKCKNINNCKSAGNHIRISHLVLAMKEFKSTTGLEAGKVEDVSWEFLKGFLDANFDIQLRKFCEEAVYVDAQKTYNAGFKKLLLNQATRKPTAKYNWGDWWAYSNSTSLMRVSRFTYHTHKLSEFDVTTSKYPVLNTTLLGLGVVGASIVGILFI